MAMYLRTLGHTPEFMSASLNISDTPLIYPRVCRVSRGPVISRPDGQELPSTRGRFVGHKGTDTRGR